MVPTVLPVVVTVGAMGVLGVPLDPGSAMVAAVVLGISDDDAIHLPHAVPPHARRGGLAPADAVDGDLLHAGRAIVTTSLTLAVGFSPSRSRRGRASRASALLSALAILAALGAVLVVLPALLYGAAGGSSSEPRSAS